MDTFFLLFLVFVVFYTGADGYGWRLAFGGILSVCVDGN